MYSVFMRTREGPFFLLFFDIVTNVKQWKNYIKTNCNDIELHVKGYERHFEIKKTCMKLVLGIYLF